VTLVIGGFTLAGSASAQPVAAQAPAAHAAAARTTAPAYTTAATSIGGFSVSGPADYRRACAVTKVPGRDACMVLIRTNVQHRSQSSLGPDAAPVGDGYGPIQPAERLCPPVFDRGQRADGSGR
jgi:hypothetical protein